MDPKLVIFSGGTGFNSVARDLLSYTESTAYVIPVSDDGGSTAEIIRYFGGPAIGDIRSRCLRLSAYNTKESKAVNRLLGHRLHGSDPLQAKEEFYQVLEGTHVLWRDVSEAYKHTVRAFLVHFHSTMMHESYGNKHFSYVNGSLGNFFFKGAQLFFGSMEAAIFLYSRVSGIPRKVNVLPCIRTNERVVLGAELVDGSRIRGQSNISHPVEKGRGTFVSKGEDLPLPSPIKRVYYMPSEAMHLVDEVYPTLNSDVEDVLKKADAVIYAMGSLYTSISPSLVVRGMGGVVGGVTGPKIMLLNGSYDRETYGMKAHDFVLAVASALNHAGQRDNTTSESEAESNSDFTPLSLPVSSYVTAVLVPKNSAVTVAEEILKGELGIQTVEYVESERDGDNVRFNSHAFVHALKQLCG